MGCPFSLEASFCLPDKGLSWGQIPTCGLLARLCVWKGWELQGVGLGPLDLYFVPAVGLWVASLRCPPAEGPCEHHSCRPDE